MALAAVAFAAVAAVGWAFPMEAAAQAPDENFWGQAPQNLRRTPVVRVFERNRRSVVNINTTQIIRQRFGLFGDDPFFNDPFFRRFFGPGAPGFERDVKRTSLGSGFVVHGEGYIVTNAHVVDNADEVEVILAGDEHLPARVLASDAERDLAVLKVEPPAGVELAPVTLGDSSDLMIGEPVVAIGNPLGYEHSVTAGIVSAVGRSLPVGRDWELEGLVQTDASINPGNSGGPLLNAYGQVIGINTAIRGDAQNIGFAIPVNELRRLIPELLSPALLKRIEIGGRIVERRRIRPPADIEVTLRWRPNGQQEPGPVVRAINGRPVHHIIDAYVALLDLEAGRELVLETDEGRITRAVRPAPLPDGVRLARAMMGAAVRELSRSEARRAGLSGGGGLLIEAVAPDGPADRAGLRGGDVIVQVGRFRVDDLQTLAAVLSEAEAGSAADVYVIRRGRIGRARLRLRGETADAL